MRLLAALLVNVCLISPALAEEEKSPSVAVGLSLGVTTAGVVTLLATDNHSLSLLGFGAMFVGPSTGRWYAGEIGGIGLGARAVGLVSSVYGLSLMLQSENDCEPDIDGDCSAENARSDRQAATGTLLMLAGAGLWVGSSIADVVFAKRAADRWNANHGLAIAPTAVGPSHAPGLVLTGRF